MRRPIVGMSYKTYINTIDTATKKADELVEAAGKEKSIEKFIFPSIGLIYPVAKAIENSEINFGAQNISPYLEGAYTGELSIVSVKDIGGKYIEIGHAERKNIFYETLDMLNLKVKLTLEQNLIPVICIGENERIEDFDKGKKFFQAQIDAILNGINNEYLSNIILAYEPEWAIGKQKAADSSYVHMIHSMLREIISEFYGNEAADNIRIIYGGSVSENNVSEIVDHSDVDGVFVGRFGHDANNYQQILNSVKKLKVGN